MSDAERHEIQLLRQRHLDRDFPARLRGEVINGVDIVMVDADIHGCAHVWLDSTSNLDAARIQILRACRADLDRVLPELTDPAEVEYYASLRDLAAAVLSAQRGWQ